MSSSIYFLIFFHCLQPALKAFASGKAAVTTASGYIRQHELYQPHVTEAISRICIKIIRKPVARHQATRFCACKYTPIQGKSKIKQQEIALRLAPCATYAYDTALISYGLASGAHIGHFAEDKVSGRKRPSIAMQKVLFCIAKEHLSQHIEHQSVTR